MDEDTIFEAPGRRHIIKRPRLTRMLDEATARIILLVAPAGYGKTTLAREWLAQGDRQSAWYTAGPASADVAALATGVAAVVAGAVEHAGGRLNQRLRASKTPVHATSELSELLAEDLSEWPANMWLVIDDYHHLVSSSAAEVFLERLLDLAPLRLLVTSRERPNWATPRRIMYGEITEVGRTLLAMDPDEADSILVRWPKGQVSGLLALAEGWPAVIGLAALTRSQALLRGDLPRALYDYFAQELFEAIPHALRMPLARISLLPSIEAELVDQVLPDDGPAVLAHATRVGFLLPKSPIGYELHPLLRSFLNQQLAHCPPRVVREDVRILGRELIDRTRWDEAFVVLAPHAEYDLLTELVEQALQDLVRTGRLATLERWLEVVPAHAGGPAIDVARAHLALFKGEYDRVDALVDHALRELGDGHRLSSKSYFVAGEAANLADRRSRAREHFRKARLCSTSRADRCQAIWGEFLASGDDERDDAAHLLLEFRAFDDGSSEHAVRIANGALFLAERFGNVADALDTAMPTLHLIDSVEDPLIRSAYLNMLTSTLTLAGRYAEALAVAERELEEAQRYRLAFVLPLAHLNIAASQTGLRRFRESRKSLASAAGADGSGNEYLQTNLRVQLARLGLAQGRSEVALSLADDRFPSCVTPGLKGELLGIAAVAHASVGDVGRAVALAREADRLSRSVETAVLASCARAISSVHSAAANTARRLHEVVDVLRTRGNLDGLVTAYRAFPPLLRVLARDETFHEDLKEVVLRAHDSALGVSVGLLRRKREPLSADLLTPREVEVYALLAEGASNKEIARALYITEVTAKVHVRHIFAKLGVRSRTEAAVLAARRRPD